MAKPQAAAPEKLERVRTFRVIPARDDAGKVIPEKWDTEEVTVIGRIESRVVHEKAQSLPVARERHQLLIQRYIGRESPETWE